MHTIIFVKQQIMSALLARNYIQADVFFEQSGNPILQRFDVSFTSQKSAGSVKPIPARSARVAFTLIELLAVIVIISILSVLLMPTLKSTLDSARQIKCMSNLRQIGLALLSYSQENDGLAVAGPQWTGKLLPYVKDKKVFICPSSREIDGMVQSLPEEYTHNWVSPGSSYELNMLSFSAGPPTPPSNYDNPPCMVDTVKLSRFESPADTAWVWDGWSGMAASTQALTNIFQKLLLPRGARHKHGLNVLFCDGHVEFIPPTKNLSDSQFTIQND
jgi:prepilin-type processing-associated H-X9-DG protein/prepilin-type N-terminal cleavage/methylation domain-containing protein